MIYYYNYEPSFNDFFSRKKLSRKKIGAHVKNVDDKKVKECIGFYYLVTEIQL